MVTYVSEQLVASNSQVPLVDYLEYGGGQLIRNVVPVNQCALLHIPVNPDSSSALLWESYLDFSVFPLPSSCTRVRRNALD